MRIIACVALLFVLIACGTEGSPGSGPSADPPSADLPSGEYVVTSITVAGSRHALVKESELRITFRDGTLGLNAGCNHLSGTVTRSGDTLTVGPIGGTEMGCEPALMEQDTWLAGLFEEPVTIQDEPLTLTSGDTVLALTPRAKVSPDRALTRTGWVLDSVIDGETVSSIPAGEKVVLTLDGAGRAAITGLCNGWSADVEVTADDVTWSPGMRTLMACADDERMQLDNTVSALLTGPTTYAVGERSLTLTRGKQGLGFVAR